MYVYVCVCVARYCISFTCPARPTYLPSQPSCPSSLFSHSCSHVFLLHILFFPSPLSPPLWCKQVQSTLSAPDLSSFPLPARHPSLAIPVVTSFSYTSSSFLPLFLFLYDVHRLSLLYQPQGAAFPMVELLVSPWSQHRQWSYDLRLCAGVLCKSPLPRGGTYAWTGHPSASNHQLAHH